MITENFKIACRKAAKKTAENFHTLAMRELAKGLETDQGNDIAARCDGIEDEHERLGSLSSELRNRRRLLWAELETAIMAKFGKEGMKLAHDAL